ncbi:MAG: hypothetical protein JWO59_1805, partial [Chloroflexi bacterium]|nr:hypothetical protein [Chloroflexota bacterium]
GTPRAQRLLERAFAQRKITAITGHNIEHVERDAVYLWGGRSLPTIFTMVIPTFHGVPDIWKSSGLTRYARLCTGGCTVPPFNLP